MSETQEAIIEIIKEQPDDSSFDEIVHELAFARMIERGLTDADAKRTITNEEMLRRIRSW